VKAHAPSAVQTLLEAPTGLGQGTHRVPHEVALVSETQTPLQLWDPEGHCESQAASDWIHAPLHSFCVSGHLPPHTPAEQVAVPLVTDGQGAHEVPQLAGSESLRHFPEPVQKWKPVLQLIAQEPARHTEVPLGSVEQDAHEAPQAVGLSSRAHEFPQAW
jgi:hypothetical protein